MFERYFFVKKPDRRCTELVEVFPAVLVDRVAGVDGDLFLARFRENLSGLRYCVFLFISNGVLVVIWYKHITTNHIFGSSVVHRHY